MPLAVGLLAAGVCLSTALFAIVDSVVWAPSPFRESDRVFRITQSFEFGARPTGTEITDAIDAFHDRTVAASTAYVAPGATLDTGAGARIVEYQVSAEFFETVGLRPVRGRTLRREDAGTVPRVAVAESVMRAFGWRLNTTVDAPWSPGLRVEVVGVMPDTAWFPFGANVWSIASPPGPFELPGYVRLADGADVEVLRTRAPKFILTPIDDVYRPADRSVAVLAAWLTVALCGLLVAQLFAMASVDRGRRGYDEAVRRSLGATEAQLFRRRAGAMLVMAFFSVSAAALMIVPALRAFASVMPSEFFRHAPAGVSWRTVILGVSMALLGAGVYWRPTAALPLGVSGRAQPGHDAAGRLQTGVMLATSVAIAYVTAVAVSNFIALQRVDLGFTPDDVIEVKTGSARATDVEGLIRELSHLAGVRRVGGSLVRPLSVAAFRSTLHAAGLECRPPTVRVNYVSEGYFETLALRSRERESERESLRAGEALVNRTLARQLRACGVEPLGLAVAATPMRAEIVGVVEDTPDREIGIAPDPLIYFLAPPGLARLMTVYVRADDREAIGRVRSVAAVMVQDSQMADVTWLTTAVTQALRPHRARTLLLTMYAATALALALLGVAAQQLASLHRNRRVVAVKLAIGAGSSALRREAVRRASLEIVAGVVAGGALGLIINAQGAALFPQMPPISPGLAAVVMGTVAVIGIGVAATASAGIDRISPVEVLKTI